MAQKLEAIRGGGGSIKVGTTGKISALMTKELEHPRNAAVQKPGSKLKGVQVTVTAGASIPKKTQTQKSLDGASSSKSSFGHSGSSEMARKTKSYPKGTHSIPMLGSDNVALDRTPVRQKNERRLNIVEIVDVKCGNTERAWTSPIKNRLKKLGFSKLNQTIA